MADPKAPWRNRIVGYGDEDPEQLLANPRNWRIHPGTQQAALGGVLEEVGWVDDVIVNQRTGFVIDGHLRIALALRNEAETVPVKYVDLTEDEELLVLSTLDPIAAMAVTDVALLDGLLEDLKTDDADLQAILDQVGKQNLPVRVGSGDATTLVERFVVPPFSILDARQGYWQKRKYAWMGLGIEGELGRPSGLTYGKSLPMQDSNFYRKGGKLGDDPVVPPDLTQIPGKGTSIFDPVLTELTYRWFSPPGGSVLDPFAGGSVRGIVAAWLDHPYTGIDLNPKQIEANEQQADAILDPDHHKRPTWISGDARDLDDLLPADFEADLLFTCPPYYDLEVYSDDERDLSQSGTYEDFLGAFGGIVRAGVSHLRDNRFAIVLMGDLRDKQGFYRNLPADTIALFQDAGMTLYNEAVLLTKVTTLAVRAARPFQKSRKLGKSHQNYLVFYRGDPDVIREWGDVEVGEIIPDEDYET